MTEENTPNNDDPTLTANALKAMAHPLRWRILCVLGEQELPVHEIVDRIGTSQSNISQHLDQLRSKGLLVSRKDANKMFYKIRNEQLLLLIGEMRSVLCQTNLTD